MGIIYAKKYLQETCNRKIQTSIVKMINFYLETCSMWTWILHLSSRAFTSHNALFWLLRFAAVFGTELLTAQVKIQHQWCRTCYETKCDEFFNSL